MVPYLLTSLFWGTRVLGPVSPLPIMKGLLLHQGHEMQRESENLSNLGMIADIDI
jgi:hypothetical protein